MRRLVSSLFVALAVLVALVDATLWRWLTWIGRQLARLPLFAWLERLVERLSPAAVIAVFVLPFVPIIPLLKLGEFWLLAHHHYVAAVLVIVGSKVIGAAFSTRVFAIAKPKMLQVRWFAAAYGLATRLLERGHQVLESMPAWIAARAAVRRGMARLQGSGALGRRWEAARRLLSRRR